MTWQRIDENTYIDDTLVTCAEYQLFIDEMREQGKYYQPDHWTSYQFPDGRAHEPMLGVRFSDALAFCAWLAQRESGKWHYRLPSQKDATKFTLKALDQSSLGYWVDEKFHLVWIGPSPKDARKIDTMMNEFENILSLDSASILDKEFNANRNNARDLARAMMRALERAQISPLDMAKNIEIFNKKASNLGRAQEYDFARDLNLNIALDLKFCRDESLDITKSRHHILVHAHSITIARNKMINYSGDLVSNRDRALTLDFGSILKQLILPWFIAIPQFFSDLDRARARAKAVRALDHTREEVLDFSSTLSVIRDSALDLYIDLFTLQERIAGRSPAFEGIRLVKERIK